eukprot:5288365-Lingulodinium_polyedra.AAC.1
MGPRHLFAQPKQSPTCLGNTTARNQAPPAREKAWLSVGPAPSSPPYPTVAPPARETWLFGRGRALFLAAAP